MKFLPIRWKEVFLPFIGAAVFILIWWALSNLPNTNLPSPAKTWLASKPYLVEPFAKRGEMDQGILRFTWNSLKLVAQGYTLALLVGIPLGFFLGMSKLFTKSFDPIMQVLRPVSPLAWLPLGLVLFRQSTPAAIFTVAGDRILLQLLFRNRRPATRQRPAISDSSRV